ncbi:21955_t:CDS:2, partial [Gigaspora margarita]
KEIKKEEKINSKYSILIECSSKTCYKRQKHDRESEEISFEYIEKICLLYKQYAYKLYSKYIIFNTEQIELKNFYKEFTHQFCIDLQVLKDNFYFDDKYEYELYKNFQKKYKQTLNLFVEYVYLKSKTLNNKDSIVAFLYIVTKVEITLYLFSKKIYTIQEEKNNSELYTIEEKLEEEEENSITSYSIDISEKDF